MPAPPGMSQEEYVALKKKQKEKNDLKAAEATYTRKYAPDTHVDELGTEALEGEGGWMREGEWVPSWGIVEFDADGCLKNVTKAGKEKDGFFAPAGTSLPLGAAMPEMTVLKYGGYFPAGTSFPGGVMVPLHARMVNLLPQMTIDKSDPFNDESLCVVQ